MPHKLSGLHNRMYKFDKINRSMPKWKCSVSLVDAILDRKHIYVQPLGGTCDHEDCVGFRRNYIKQERFWPRQNKAKRQIDFTENLNSHPWIFAFQPSLIRSYFTHTYTSSNKKNKKRSRLYFYISALLLSFPEYNTYSETIFLFDLIFYDILLQFLKKKRKLFFYFIWYSFLSLLIQKIIKRKILILSFIF